MATDMPVLLYYNELTITNRLNALSDRSNKF